MNHDTLIAVVHDTVFVTQEKIDTIYKVVHDTIYIAQKNDIISAYQKTIDAQASTYNIIITVFLGLVALFAGATWWYNRRAAKSEIIDEVHKVFAKEKKDFLAGQKLEFNNELHIQKAESARLFALFNISIIEKAENDQDRLSGHANLIYWWHEVFINNFIAANPVGERLGIDNLIISLEKINIENIEKEFFTTYQTIYNYQDLYDTLRYINDSLMGERNRIHSLLNHIAKENGLEFFPKETDSEKESNEQK